MVRPWRRPGLLLAALLAALLLYEGFAVWRAWRNTPAVVERARQGPLSLADLTPERRRWIIAIEDPSFETHHGLDFTTPGQGNTNLTQSLVKRFYFDRFEPGFAKIEQVLIAWLVLDRALSKDEQLRAYLNHAYLGQHGGAVIGYEAGARRYFGRGFRDLDDRQFLSLLAMTIAPRELNPRANPAANAERVRRLRRLLAGACQPGDRGDVRYERC